MRIPFFFFFYFYFYDDGDDDYSSPSYRSLTLIVLCC